MAFDQKTGDVAWKALDFANSYSTPKLIKIGGKDQLVIFMASQIIGVDPADGSLKWEHSCENQWKQNVCMPIWDEKERILFYSSNDVGAFGLKLTPKGDKTDVKELWSTKKIQLYHVTSVRIGDYVYGSTGAMAPAFFSAINMKTGEVAWRKRGFSKATCVLADGKLIILDEDGKLGIATPTPKDLQVHSETTLLDKVAWTVPTVVGKTLYVRDKKSIVAVDLG